MMHTSDQKYVDSCLFLAKRYLIRKLQIEGVGWNLFFIRAVVEYYDTTRYIFKCWHL